MRSALRKMMATGPAAAPSSIFRSASTGDYVLRPDASIVICDLMRQLEFALAFDPARDRQLRHAVEIGDGDGADQSRCALCPNARNHNRQVEFNRPNPRMPARKKARYFRTPGIYWPPSKK
jgi:hypothetical protein